MFDRQLALKRFVQPEDKLLFAKAMDRADLSLKRHEKRFTFFMSPGHIFKFKPYFDLMANELNYMIYGGFEDCERAMVGFCPDYMTLSREDFPIKAVEIAADKRFALSLSHRDYLGSVLGLGIDRDRTGDIIIKDGRAILIAEEEIAQYVSLNLFKVGKTPVKCMVTGLDSLDFGQKTVKEFFSTVPSLRLDCVLGVAFSLSRGAAKALIDEEKVSVNWEIARSASQSVNEGDMLSARGFGRAQIIEVKGKTKKDRVGVIIGRYV